jgi:DNA-binding beta-propeller fold protein YncE
VTLNQGASIALTVNVRNAAGQPLSGRTVTWRSWDTTAVRITSVGTVSAVGRAINARVSVNCGPAADTVDVVVASVATTIAASPSSLTLGKGGWGPLIVRVLDAAGDTMVSAVPTVTVSGSAIVAISGQTVTSLGIIGTSTLTAAFGAVSRPIPVTVLASYHPQGVFESAIHPLQAPSDVAISISGVLLAPSRAGNAGLTRILLPSIVSAFSISPVDAGASIAISRDGLMAAAGENYSIAIINLATAAVVGRVSTIEAAALGFSSDGSFLFVGGTHRFFVVDVATRAVVDSLVLPEDVERLVVHPTQPLVYALLKFNVGLLEINTSALAIVRTLVAADSWDLAVSPDGNELAVSYPGASLDVYDLPSGQLKGSVPFRGGYGVAYSPDGAQIWVAAGDSLRVFDRPTRAVVRTVRASGTFMAFTADGGRVVVADYQNGNLNIVR